MTTPSIEPRALTIPDACRRYAIGRTTLYGEIRHGRLRVVKIGKKTLLDLRELERWWSVLADAQQ